MGFIKFDINHAGIEELSGIPGMDERTAQAIIEHRRTIGQFHEFDDIRKVEGILDTMVDRLQEHTWVGPLHDSEKTDINHACKDELAILPFIGTRNAETIVSYRKLNGEFQSIEDVDAIPGIDESVKRMLKRYTRICSEHMACSV